MAPGSLQRETKEGMAVGGLKLGHAVVALFILLKLDTTNAAILTDHKSSAKPNTRWANSPSIVGGSYEFTDGSQFRTILQRRSKDYPKFGFGFFRNATDEIFYLVTIRFLRSSNSSEEDFNLPPVILWFANGDSPVKENASLEFNTNGGLFLRDTASVPPVWSTNTYRTKIAYMTLDGNGDLRLVDDKKKSLWQSFSHPTHLWLPIKQFLPLKSNLNATVSVSNLSTGMFFLTLSEKGIHLYFNTRNPQPYQTIPYENTFPEGLEFSINRNYVSYRANGSHFKYIRLESNGHLNFYPCADGDTIPKSFDLSRDENYGNCIYPTYCGTYGICYNDICSCPGASAGDSSYFKRSKSTDNGGFSCSEVTPLSCKHLKRHKLLQLDNVAYFEFVPDHGHINTDVESCKRACQSNCSCKAAFFRYRGNRSIGNCSLSTEIYTLRNITGQAISHYHAITFLKYQTPDKNKISLLFIALQVLSISAFVVLINGICYFYECMGRITGKECRNNSVEDEFSIIVNKRLRKFGLEDMRSATWNFKVTLGEGGYGPVYEGILDDGTRVAVKRLASHGSQGTREFRSEVETIGNIHHFNLVRLVGYCAQRSNRFLVYEYMSNGSLDKWIFHQNQPQTLAWETRKKIIIQIAKGLEYLHESCNPNIIHFDIKPQNILLDKDLNVKISDFGLARLIDRDQSHLSTMAKGTPGYMAPEFIRAGQSITPKIDIYSFGIVILEIICGRKSSDSRHSDYLIDTVRIKAEEDRLSDVIDKQSEDMQRKKEDVVKVVRIAISCLQTDTSRRPSASELVKVLEGLTDLEPITDYRFLNFVYWNTPEEVLPAYLSHASVMKSFL